MSKINAVILKKPGDYEYTQIEKPICDEYGILIKVMACGLCGSDLRTLKSGHKNVQLPAVLGHEVAGRIVEVGKYYCGEYKVGEEYRSSACCLLRRMRFLPRRAGLNFAKI